MTRLAPLTLLVALALPVAAQTSFTTPLVPPSSAAAYAGLYATDGGMLEVRAEGADVALVAHGAEVAARLAPLVESETATDRRVLPLLDAWITDDLATVAAEVRPSRQAEAAEAFAAYRAALVRGHGPAVAGSVVGTFRQIDGRAATLVQLLFDHGVEWASFVWDEDDTLVAVTRGLSPIVLGTAQATDTDAFAHGVTGIAFDRSADGAVEAVRIGDRFAAIR